MVVRVAWYCSQPAEPAPAWAHRTEGGTAGRLASRPAGRPACRAPGRCLSPTHPPRPTRSRGRRYTPLSATQERHTSGRRHLDLVCDRVLAAAPARCRAPGWGAPTRRPGWGAALAVDSPARPPFPPPISPSLTERTRVRAALLLSHSARCPRGPVYNEKRGRQTIGQGTHVVWVGTSEHATKEGSCGSGHCPARLPRRAIKQPNPHGPSCDEAKELQTDATAAAATKRAIFSFMRAARTNRTGPSR